MTKQRMDEIRGLANGAWGVSGKERDALAECLDEIERLQKELKKANRLPDSMQEAFNSGDGSYKP